MTFAHYEVYHSSISVKKLFASLRKFRNLLTFAQSTFHFISLPSTPIKSHEVPKNSQIITTVTTSNLHIILGS